MKVTGAKARPAILDPDILNFALNLEYLEAEFYHRAVFGTGLARATLTGSGTGSGAQGTVTGGSKVPVPVAHHVSAGRRDRPGRACPRDAAASGPVHRRLLRGRRAGDRPGDQLHRRRHGRRRHQRGQTFNPFANESSFLLGAFIFEDVGVSAYAGAAALITSKSYLTVAAQILAVEAYHAGEIRTRLFMAGYARRPTISRPRAPSCPAPVRAPRLPQTTTASSSMARRRSSMPTATPWPTRAPPRRCSTSSISAHPLRRAASSRPA